MKNFYKWVCLLAFIVAGHSLKAYDFSAVAPSGQTLYYNIVSGHAEVTCPTQSWNGFSTPVGRVVVPSSVVHNGVTYQVTAIGAWAFGDCKNIVTVSLPECIQDIKPHAFRCCSLVYIEIPDNVVSIGYQAFCGCTAIQSVVVGNSVSSIGWMAFDGCYSLRSVTMKRQTPPSGGFEQAGGQSLGLILNNNCQLILPCGSIQAYSNWNTDVFPSDRRNEACGTVCGRIGYITSELSDTATLKLHWNNISAANGYTIVYGKSASDDPDDILADSINTMLIYEDSVSVSLEPCTFYYFWVRTNCCTFSSDWFGPIKGSTIQSKTMLASGTDTLYNACGWALYDDGGLF